MTVVFFCHFCTKMIIRVNEHFCEVLKLHDFLRHGVLARQMFGDWSCCRWCRYRGLRTGVQCAVISTTKWRMQLTAATTGHDWPYMTYSRLTTVSSASPRSTASAASPARQLSQFEVSLWSFMSSLINLIGRITGLARPSVCFVRASSTKTNKRRENRIVCESFPSQSNQHDVFYLKRSVAKIKVRIV